MASAAVLTDLESSGLAAGVLIVFGMEFPFRFPCGGNGTDASVLADADQRLLTAADQYRLELELLGQSFDGAAAPTLATGERVNRLGDFVREPRGFRVVGEE
jgi:hypothetical protein